MLLRTALGALAAVLVCAAAPRRQDHGDGGAGGQSDRDAATRQAARVQRARALRLQVRLGAHLQARRIALRR